jgi:hypothetical protein
VSGNVGDLRPDNKTVFITEVVEILIVLIVSKSYCGSTNLHNEVDVLSVMLGEKRITYTKSVLVTGYTAKRILLTVEDEAVFGINLEASYTESCRNVINNLAAAYDSRLCGIEVRIASAVPEVNVLYMKVNEVVRGLSLSYNVTLLIGNGIEDLIALLLVGNEYLYLYVAVNRGSNLDAGATVVVEVKVGIVYCDKVNVTVKTAVEGEVCHLRIYGFVRRVVHNDSNLALLTDRIGKIYSPGGVTAIVMSLVLTVYVYVSGRVCAAYFKIILISLGELSLHKLLGVKTSAAEVVVAAVLTVSSVPCVGEIYAYNTVVVRSGSAVLRKLPAFIKGKNFSHFVLRVLF